MLTHGQQAGPVEPDEAIAAPHGGDDQRWPHAVMAAVVVRSRRGPASHRGRPALAQQRAQAASFPAILTTRSAMWSRAENWASPSGASLLPPVTCETPYGLPSANFSGSV